MAERSPNNRRKPPPLLSFDEPDENSEEGGANAAGGLACSVVEARVEGLPPIALSGSFGWARGPHDTCNYVLPKQLLAGSYPGSKREPEHTAKIRACLEVGVDCFLCLQPLEEVSLRFVPYAKVAKRLVDEEGSRGRGHELEFLHLPMPDGGVTEDAALRTGLTAIVERIRAGRIVYVHCWGGHGRTGTLICALLVSYYGLTTVQAQEYCMHAHTQRASPHAAGYWPHSQEQWDQVERMAGEDVRGSEMIGAAAEVLPALPDWALLSDEDA